MLATDVTVSIVNVCLCRANGRHADSSQVRKTAFEKLHAYE